MSARITCERITYECRPYTMIDDEPVCGGCRDPMEAVPGTVREVGKRDEVGPCARCGKPSADWPVFTNTGVATIEHVACRIF